MASRKSKPKIVLAERFKPKLVKPGELILAEDWNDMQSDIRSDLDELANILGTIRDRSNVIVASGVASHGVYVTLNWPTTPHVMLSLSGAVEGIANETVNFRCYPYDISSDGFSVFAKSTDGQYTGVVNWLAIGVV